MTTCSSDPSGLVDDIHEINPALSGISDPALFPERGLPTSPNRTFRTTCNIAFGRFAAAVRARDGQSLNDVLRMVIINLRPNPYLAPIGIREIIYGCSQSAPE